MSVTLSVYKILECLLETDTFDSIFQLGIANEELYASLQEIKEAVQNENILQAPPVLTITEGGEYASDCLLPEHSRKRGTGVIRGSVYGFCRKFAEMSEESILACRMQCAHHPLFT